jgi:hypothetical protein
MERPRLTRFAADGIDDSRETPARFTQPQTHVRSAFRIGDEFEPSAVAAGVPVSHGEISKLIRPRLGRRPSKNLQLHLADRAFSADHFAPFGTTPDWSDGFLPAQVPEPHF